MASDCLAIGSLPTIFPTVFTPAGQNDPTQLARKRFSQARRLARGCPLYTGLAATRLAALAARSLPELPFHLPRPLSAGYVFIRVTWSTT